MLTLFFTGVLIGFSIAAPVGPIGVLCLRRTLAHGRLSGLVSGLGAATADACYGCLAAFGLTAVSNLLIAQQDWLRLAGGAFIFILGLRTFFSQAQNLAATEATSLTKGVQSRRHLWGDFLSTLGLTLTNPLTILSFAALLAGLGALAQGLVSGLWVVLGVFSGSAAWWLILSSAADFFRQRFLRPGSLRWINRASGLILLGFGLAALLSGVQRLSVPAQALSTPLGQPAEASAPLSLEGFARADGSYPLTFPADLGAHPQYQTEWWYYTGNLQTAEGRHFGYQLTFFRRALVPPDQAVERTSAWATNQVYLAHFALSDIQGKKHTEFERLSRGAIGLAGAQAQPYAVWLQDWQVRAVEPSQPCSLPAYLPCEYLLQAGQGDLRLDLKLVDRKGPVFQGDQGYSPKGPAPGQASYYYSLTRLETEGTVQIGGQSYAVRGLSWKDHEFSTSALAADQIGWDWFSLQLNDDSELMVFQIRKQDGSIDPFSSGTWIAPDGSTVPLSKEDFEIRPLGEWSSPNSKATYPARWLIRIPRLELEVEITPLLADQELLVSYIYWEGAVRFQGQRQGRPIQGFGYVELTGYAASMGGEF